MSKLWSHTELLDAALEEEEGGTLIARKVGEAVQNTLGAVVTAIDIPLGEFFTVFHSFMNMLTWYVNTNMNSNWKYSISYLQYILLIYSLNL